MAPVPPDLTVNSRVLVKAVEGEDPLPGKECKEFGLHHVASIAWLVSNCQVPFCSWGRLNLLRAHGLVWSWMKLKERTMALCSTRNAISILLFMVIDCFPRTNSILMIVVALSCDKDFTFRVNTLQSCTGTRCELFHGSPQPRPVCSCS